MNVSNIPCRLRSTKLWEKLPIQPTVPRRKARKRTVAQIKPKLSSLQGKKRPRIAPSLEIDEKHELGECKKAPDFEYDFSETRQR